MDVLVGGTAVGFGRDVDAAPALVGAGGFGKGVEIIGRVGGGAAGEIAPGVLVWRRIDVSVGNLIGMAVNTGKVPRRLAINAGGLLFKNPDTAT